jgi:hypothetical protein
MAEQFSIETFIFILILIVYVLTAHLIEVEKVRKGSARFLSCTNHQSPFLWAY